eukprot:5476925-Amphidinium_carterae.1
MAKESTDALRGLEARQQGPTRPADCLRKEAAEGAGGASGRVVSGGLGESSRLHGDAFIESYPCGLSWYDHWTSLRVRGPHRRASVVPSNWLESEQPDCPRQELAALRL